MLPLRSAFLVSADTLRGSPLRTFLSTLGIVIGVASLVAILSLGDGMTQFVHSEIGASTDLQMMRLSSRATRTVDGTPIPRADTIHFTPDDARSLSGSLGDSVTVGLIANGTALTLVGATQRVVRLLAISPGFAGAANLEVAAGRALSEGDASEPRLLLLRAPTIEAVNDMRTLTERWLSGRYGVAWADRVELVNNAKMVANTQRGILLFKLFMGAITGISLVVGGIGVMNVLLAAVAERTREIGVRRAVGAARGHILAQFLAEAVTISGLGSAAGIVLGLAASYGITALLRARAQVPLYAGISPNTIIVAVATTVAVGLSFGLYPAQRASRLSPIDAIRDE